MAKVDAATTLLAIAPLRRGEAFDTSIESMLQASVEIKIQKQIPLRTFNDLIAITHILISDIVVHQGQVNLRQRYLTAMSQRDRS